MRKSLLLNPNYWKVPVVIVIMLLTIVDGADKNCSVSRCLRGGGPDIQFPFWLKQDNSTSGEPGDDCAHLPGFRLACAVSDSLGSGGYGSYYKGDTLVEFEHIVNTSIKGLQLSFKFKAVVSFIDYSSQSMYLYDTPFLTDIVPTYSVLTSSSSSSTLDALYGSYICSLPFGCFENYDDDLGYCYYCPYEQDYTFFNCSSSSSAVIEYNSIWIINSLSTADFKIFAYPSVKYDVISSLDKIRSCTKMYDLYTVQYLHSCKYPNQYYGVPYTLSWSRAVGGEKCKAVRETCKIYDDDDNQTSTYPDYFPPSPGGGGSGSNLTGEEEFVICRRAN